MEIETKIVDMDMDEFRRDITSLGATKKFEGTLNTLLFDDGKISKSGSMVRLRDYGKYAEITYKGPQKKGKYKQREEINLKVDDFVNARELFLSMGYKIVKKYEKHREIFELDWSGRHYEIVIDDYFIIPKFAEIEAKSEKDIDIILKKLKISKKNLFNRSFSDLIKKYGKTL